MATMVDSRIERSRLPPVAWFMILVISLFFVLTLVLSAYEGLLDPEAWKSLILTLVQSCFIASLICCFNSGRSMDSEMMSMKVANH